MMRHISLGRLVLVVAFLTLMVSAALAVDTEVTRRTLKNLPGVYVVIEEMQTGIQLHTKRFGLTQDQIQTGVERQLKDSGIRVLLRDEWMKTPAKPVLYVGVNTHEKERYFWAYDIKVELQQIVRMEVNPDIRALATTWSINMTGMTNVGKLQVIRSDLGVLVGRFIGAFRATNP